MDQLLSDQVQVQKRANQYTVIDGETGKRLYHVADRPTYDSFDLDNPILLGVGSTLNVTGNFYSFEKYLSKSDEDAIASDWQEVGMDFWDILSSFNGK